MIALTCIAEIERLNDENAHLKADLAKAIDACIAESWNCPPGRICSTGQRITHGWEWHVMGMGDFVATQDEARRAVRGAMGIGRATTGGPK